MKEMDQDQFGLHTRMPRKLYDMLLASIKVYITKPKQMIDADERLSITLLFLAQGVTIQAIAWSYKLGKSTVRLIILEICEAIWSVLFPLYLSEPTAYQSKDIANDFENLWNFPNCIGAIDGRHVAIKCPANSGTNFFNYKKNFSIGLMDMCDAKYALTAVSIDSESDGGIFRISHFGHAVLNDTLPLPNSISQEALPYVFPADAAFPLSNCFVWMKTFSNIACKEFKYLNYKRTAKSMGTFPNQNNLQN